MPGLPMNWALKKSFFFYIGSGAMNKAGFYEDGNCQAKPRFDEYVPILNITDKGFMLDGVMYFEIQCQKRGEDEFKEVITVRA